MKTLFSLILLFFSVAVFSQVSFEHMVDFRSDRMLTQSSSVNIYNTSGSKHISLSFQKGFDGTVTARITIPSGEKEICCDNGETVKLVLEDGTVMEFYSNNSYNCSGKVLWDFKGVSWNKKLIKKVKKLKITEITVSSMYRRHYFKVDPRSQDKIHQILNHLIDE